MQKIDKAQSRLKELMKGIFKLIKREDDEADPFLKWETDYF